MNYSHLYHAGNFSDVFKHVVLIALIQSFLQKITPFCYIETHAGAGVYDLFSEISQKNKEYESGIMRLLHEKNPPDLIKQYINCIQKTNNRLNKSLFSTLQYYAGSPMIMRYFLRNQDRMILAELHPKEYQLLRNYFGNDTQTSMHFMDGYQGLKAFLPPKEKRGLIFIDPPYEKPNELEYVVSLLPTALKRFETGVYAIWFPIKDRLSIERFYREIKQKISVPMLSFELHVYPEGSAQHLNGSGMFILNPPWQLQNTLKLCLPWLSKILGIRGQGQYRALTF